MAEQFKKPNGDKDKRMELIASQVGEMHSDMKGFKGELLEVKTTVKDMDYALRGDLKTSKEGIAHEVKKNTKFRQNMTKNITKIALGLIATILTIVLLAAFNKETIVKAIQGWF